MPIIGSDRVLGTIVIENYERENAFGEAEVRLLTTIAASMGVALENARLFDETQRLLKETEQRAPSWRSSTASRKGMAAELDFQAIVDLVGDKLREVFHTRRRRHPLVRRRRPTCVHYLYAYEHGERLTPRPVRASTGRPVRDDAADPPAGRSQHPRREQLGRH